MAHARLLDVVRLGPALGAEVRGLDLRTLSSAEFAAVHAAWMQHQVLVFPGQALSDPQQVAFTRLFGEPEIHQQAIIKSSRVPEIFRVANTDEAGQLLPPTAEPVRQLGSAQTWHTDSSYRSNPSMGTILRAVEIVQAGGETQFLNMVAVWDALPQALKDQVLGRRARHDFGFLRQLRALPPLGAEERAAMPPVWQPMVRRHPVTGRVSLYISLIYNDAVEGMSSAAAAALFRELAAFAEQPQFCFSHRWRSGDVVIWDNRCTVHRVTPWDPAERRVLHRTTIAGDGAPLGV